MKKPLISVIVPTYKRKPEMIGRAVNSILSQTYSNIELIVVDDSPKSFEYRNEIKDYLEKLNDNRIRYIQHDENQGANKARNTGIIASKGEYVAFLDDDDEWMKDKLELQLEKFDNPNVALVYCKAEIIDEVNHSIRPIINVLRKGNHFKELLKQNFIGSNSFVLIKKTSIEKVGMYNEELLSNQDYDLFLRIAEKFEINFVDKVLVKYYIHEGDRISTDPQKQLQGRLGVERNFNEQISKDEQLKLIWAIKKIPLYFKAGKKSIAVKSFFKMLLTHPIFVLKYGKGTLEYVKKIKQ